MVPGCCRCRRTETLKGTAASISKTTSNFPARILLHRKRLTLRPLEVLLSLVPILLLGFCSDLFAFAQLDSTAVRFFNRGLQAEDFSEKISYFERALAIAPDYQDALYQLGISYYQKGAFLEAISYFEQVKDNASARNRGLYLRNAYNFRAEQLYREGSYRLAMQFALDAVNLDPDYAPGQTTLGLLQAQIGESLAAIRTLEKSVSINSEQDRTVADCK